MQHGVVLFLTLIALLAMSLAAVALIRSVDTSAMIVGNLAFQRAATSSADAGIQKAIDNLKGVQGAYMLANPNSDVKVDANHPLNKTDLVNNAGYYSYFDPGLNIKDSNNWGSPKSMLVTAADSTGNKVEYIVQRMCRLNNTPLGQADCLLGDGTTVSPSQNVINSTQVCNGCAPSGQPAQVRVTVRSTGTTGAVSYVQGFIF